LEGAIEAFLAERLVELLLGGILLAARDAEMLEGFASFRVAAVDLLATRTLV